MSKDYIVELIRRVAGIEHQMEELSKRMGLLVSLVKAGALPAISPKSRDGQATRSQKKEIGVYFISRHGWPKIAQELVKVGIGLPSSFDDRSIAVAEWALSKHRLSFLLEKIKADKREG